jgi:hypothetical protein
VQYAWPFIHLKRWHCKFIWILSLVSKWCNSAVACSGPGVLLQDCMLSKVGMLRAPCSGPMPLLGELVRSQTWIAAPESHTRYSWMTGDQHDQHDQRNRTKVINSNSDPRAWCVAFTIRRPLLRCYRTWALLISKPPTSPAAFYRTDSFEVSRGTTSHNSWNWMKMKSPHPAIRPEEIP